MSDSPTFSKVDADRILKRAAEIEGVEEARRLTAEELRSIAGEAGFRPHAVERAIAEAQAAEALEVRRFPVQKWGMIIVHLSSVREIPIEVSAEQLMKVVRLLQPYRDGPAQVKLEENEVTWRDRKGLEFTITSGRGVTEIRVYVSKLLLRRGRWRAWVKAAADRLEMLVLLVASRDPQGTGGSAQRLPPGPPPEALL